MGSQINGRYRVRAVVGRTIPTQLKTEVRYILQNYHQMPILMFPIIYKREYNQIFSANDLGFDNGLIGFFQQLEQTINICQDENGNYVCSLRHSSNETNDEVGYFNGTNYYNYNLNNIAKMHSTSMRIDVSLFDVGNSILWSKFPNLLYRDDIQLVLSPYELALSENSGIIHQIRRIRQALARLPNGIPLNELLTKISVNKQLFSVTSVEDFVNNWPELFHKHVTEIEDEEPIVFNGQTTTYDDLDEVPVDVNPYCFSFRFIREGFYQRTLLLLRQAHEKGLKLSVWKESMRVNFRDFDDENSSDFLELEPLRIFKTLAYTGLVRLVAGVDIKNDIRIHFPKSVPCFYTNLEEILKPLIKSRSLIKRACLQEKQCINQLSN